jgi:hypothetical protein
LNQHAVKKIRGAIIRQSFLFELHEHPIDSLIVSQQLDARQAASAQFARQAQVDLIQTCESGLFAEIHDFDSDLPDLCSWFSHAGPSQSRAEQHEKDLLALRPRINLDRDVILILLVVAGDRLELFTLGLVPRSLLRLEAVE